VKRLNVLRGDVVLVVGQGPIGLMFTRLLTLVGVKVLATDLFETRLELARSLGAKWTLQPDAENSGLPELVQKLTRGIGLDAAVMAVPSEPAMKQAQQLVRGGGQVLLFSNTRRGDNSGIDLATICVDEKDLIGSYSADFLLQKEVARLVFSRRLDMRLLITHEFPLAETAAAVELAAHPSPESLKVIVQQ